MADLNISIGEAAKLAADYLERTEEGSIENNLGFNVGPSVQLGAADTAVAASVSADGRLGLILESEVEELEIVADKLRRPHVLVKDILNLNIGKVLNYVTQTVEVQSEYQTISAGLTTRVEGQFGEASRLNLQPGLYVRQTKATLKTRGLDVLEAGAWERWAATGPAFRSVASSHDGDEGSFGWSVSVGGGFFVRKELDLAVTASLAFALYGDGVEFTPTGGFQGSF